MRQKKHLAGLIGTTLVVALVASLVLLAGCTSGGQGGAAAGAKKPLKIAIDPWPGYSYAFVAQEKGFFKKNGVEVELVVKDSSQTKPAYKNGEVDGMFGVYSDMLLMNSEGYGGTIVYVVDYSVTGDAIVGRAEFNSLADLKGKKIGVEGINTFSHMFVLADLEKHGLKEGDFYIVNVPASEVPRALDDGTIDAGHTWNPMKDEAVVKGYKILGTAGEVPGTITDVLVFTPATVRDRPDDVQAVVKSMAEAREYLATNRQEALGIMAKNTSMSVAQMTDGINGAKLLMLDENIEAMKKSNETTSLYGSGRIISDFFIGHGQMTAEPEFDRIIDREFVNNVKQAKTG
ncbi:NMT1/THI5 like protein [Candidatus Gugararchaeum adminiculabundum]|nr:NMT1/THI5 like protein [Candidatus Gugararchaeum adminiculabundum]